MKFENNKSLLLEKALYHSKKNQFFIVKSAFKTWIQNANILERRE
jgi:hypothetical protein